MLDGVKKNVKKKEMIEIKITSSFYKVQKKEEVTTYCITNLVCCIISVFFFIYFSNEKIFCCQPQDLFFHYRLTRNTYIGTTHRRLVMRKGNKRKQ